jgi:thermitase
VDGSHPDLAGAVDSGFDFVDGDEETTDRQGHGTAVAGIAAARANNGIGAAGACWNCRILPLRVIGPDGFARNTRVAQAIDYAVARGAAVVNVSIYGENRNGWLEDAISRARAAGVLVIAAAGNEGGQVREYPAAYPDVISVGATTETGELTDYSSRGSWVKVAAPACTPTTQLGGGFGAGCGTSGATPLVAGIVALLRSQSPFATAGDIETALEQTARSLTGVRYGRVDAFGALQRLGKPAPKLLPTIHGFAGVGERLTANSGVWSRAPLAISYRWVRCRTDACRQVVTVDQTRTYRIRRADRGHRLRVVVTAMGELGTVRATSAPTRRTR